MGSVTVTGICVYHGEVAQDIADLRHVKGVLYFGQGKVHCFEKTNLPKQKDAVVVRKKAVVVPDPVPTPSSETEEQAAALWNRALKVPDPDPDPVSAPEDDRIFGVAMTWDEERGYGFVRNEDGVEFYAHRNQIAPDEYNRRFLIPKERVSFSVTNGHFGRHSGLKAAFVLPIPRVNFGVSAPSDHREEMIVTEFDPRYGTGRLSQVLDPRARWIYFETNDIISQGEVRIGSRFWCGLHRLPNWRKGFQAFAIDIFMEEKGETE